MIIIMHRHTKNCVWENIIVCEKNELLIIDNKRLGQSPEERHIEVYGDCLDE
jgi:hypothetical protein